MIKTITKVGNSRGIIFDSALLQQANLTEGDEVNVEVHAGGTITITPMNPRPVIPAATAADTARRLIRKNNDLFKRLS